MTLSQRKDYEISKYNELKQKVEAYKIDKDGGTVTYAIST
jgi:hypothetical protein